MGISRSMRSGRTRKGTRKSSVHAAQALVAFRRHNRTANPANAPKPNATSQPGLVLGSRDSQWAVENNRPTNQTSVRPLPANRVQACSGAYELAASHVLLRVGVICTTR